MKNFSEMSGAERAAALLIALGPELAGDIIKYFDEERIELLTIEMSKLGPISPDEREDLVGEFLFALRDSAKSRTGGRIEAREILKKSFGQEKADEILSRVSQKDVDAAFEFLRDAEPGIICSFIREEHPQTIALTLNYLPSDKAAGIIEGLPVNITRDVLKRMARLKNISAEAGVRIASVLKKKYKDFQSSLGAASGGVNRLIDILNHMSVEDEKRLLGGLDREMPEVYREIEGTLYNFNNIVNLTNSEIRIVIDEINDDTSIALSLKGAGDDIRFRFMRNMSRNRAADILSLMSDMGVVKLSDVEDERRRIEGVLKQLHESGIIAVKRTGERLVE